MVWCGLVMLLQYNTSLFIWQPSAGLKEKQSHTNKDTHSKLHYWKLVKENGISQLHFISILQNVFCSLWKCLYSLSRGKQRFAVKHDIVTMTWPVLACLIRGTHQQSMGFLSDCPVAVEFSAGKFVVCSDTFRQRLKIVCLCHADHRSRIRYLSKKNSRIVTIFRN